MQTQSNISAYVAAVDAATGELESIFEQAAQLQNRMDQIQSVIEALKPLFAEQDSTAMPRAGSELNPTQQQVDATLGMILV